VIGSALLVAALVPRTLLALAGGALFGTVLGAVYVLVGVTTGAALAFCVGRLLGRTFVSTRLRGRVAVVEAAVARRGCGPSSCAGSSRSSRSRCRTTPSGRPRCAPAR
jgi:uncharacterized membrane protein YdjX (TVP38/TMEM64 family)